VAEGVHLAVKTAFKFPHKSETLKIVLYSPAAVSLSYPISVHVTCRIVNQQVTDPSVCFLNVVLRTIILQTQYSIQVFTRCSATRYDNMACYGKASRNVQLCRSIKNRDIFAMLRSSSHLDDAEMISQLSNHKISIKIKMAHNRCDSFFSIEM